MTNEGSIIMGELPGAQRLLGAVRHWRGHAPGQDDRVEGVGGTLNVRDRHRRTVTRK